MIPVDVVLLTVGGALLLLPATVYMCVRATVLAFHRARAQGLIDATKIYKSVKDQP